MLDDVFLESDIVRCANPRAMGKVPYPAHLESVLSDSMFAQARAEITRWPDYQPTPLHCLPGLADRIGIKRVFLKDESTRFGLGSFKALGGAYAVQRLLRQELQRAEGKELSLRSVNDRRYDQIKKTVTVATATDGNHGRSVAWGAHMFGCQCVIYIHAEVSEGRKAAMERFGARVVRIDGNYDDSVRQAAADAARNGWFIVSDTSYDGYTDLPKQVMAGYGVMIHEAVRQLPADAGCTHVFVQGGVGGLAAAICSYLWQNMGQEKPKFIVVEPDLADCLLRSAIRGEPETITIKSETIMAGLSCGEVSLLAWDILSLGADYFVSIPDVLVAPSMRLLADGVAGDPPVVAGESAVAGLAALLVMAGNPALRDEFEINRDSKVLLFATEGATDPMIYEQLVGRKVETVRDS